MKSQGLTTYIEAIHHKLHAYAGQGKRIFTTSSFQTHSMPLLHILSELEIDVPVYFINTGYLFPETIRFRDEVTKSFGLQVEDLKPLVSKNLQRDHLGNLYFTSDPDYCCYLNKVQPLEDVLKTMDVWINGIRAEQSANRNEMAEEEQAPHATLRYHPMLRWTGKMIYDYINKFNLPRHPLDEKGYHSIGCEPCTRRMDVQNDSDRGGRWFGLKKVECGLHTELVKKQ